MMNKRITIIKADLMDERLLLHANKSIIGLIPNEQILVDSMHFSFVYLMENPEGYTYIDIPETIWSFLKITLEKRTPVWIQFEDEQMELSNFNEELEEVINNIRGNSNYGSEMVTKVEEIF